MIKIATLAAGIGLAAFFWSDIRGTVNSLAPGTKNDKTKSEAKMGKATEPASPGITVKNKWELPGVLAEISGLSSMGAGQFACVQDELGKIFIYNTQTKAIDKEILFGAPGDYEGLAIVGETAWVVRADGRLFEVADFKTKPVVKEHDTHLTAEQNVEGLCYDKSNNRLLVAIKDEEPGEARYKGIYQFDLATKKMPAAPVFKIDLEDKVFSNGNTKKKKGGIIKPSAIAVHPGTAEIYITDGPKGKLLVLDKAGAIKNLYQLDNNDFGQPEGITFTENGELFISNEGGKGVGTILNVEIKEG